jgi:mannosyltransferase
MLQGSGVPAVRSLAVSLAQQPSRSAARGDPSPTRPGSDDGTDPPGLDRAPLTIELTIVTIGAVALGLVLRFVARTPLWLDEALSVNIAKLPLGQITDALRHDGHPPLYYFMLHGWMDVFGSGDIAVRALSGVISVLTLPLAWWAARRRGGRVLAAITVALVALAPFALRYATETRMYALVMALVFVGYLLLDDVVRRGRHGFLRLAGITITTAALLYTHYWAIWLLGAVFLVLAWRAFRAGDETVRRGARLALIAVVIGGVLFVPWLPVVLYQSAHTGTPWAGPQRPTSIIATTLGDFGGGGFRDADFVGTLLAMLFALGLFGRGLSRDRIELELRTERQFRYEAVVLTLTLVFGAAAAYAASSAYASRYAAVFFPFFILIVAGGVSRFLGRWVRFGVLCVMLGLSLLGAYHGATAPRSQARQIATSVAEHAQPGDLVVYCPDQLGPAGSRVMPANLDQVVFPNFAPPERVDWVDYLDRNEKADATAFAAEAAARAGAGRGVFLVWNGEYQGVQGQCEAVLDGLSAARGGGQVLVPDAGGSYFEHAQLVWFPAQT